MITSSIVTYKTKESDIRTVVQCAIDDCIDKIYIIDNSPTDELKDIVCSMSDRIEYIFGHGNIGYGAGHNIAIKKAIELGSTYHVVLNPDIYFDKGVIPELANYMDTHQDIGQLLPKVTYPDGSLQYLCKLLPTPMDMFGRRLLPKKWMDRRNYRYEMRETGYDKIRVVPILSGCFMFLRMSVIQKIGLFDDRFFMYFEDFDLTRRIRRISKTVYYPCVSIVHNHAAEHRTSSKLLKCSISSAIKYFNKWGWLFDRECKMVNKDAFSDKHIMV